MPEGVKRSRRGFARGGWTHLLGTGLVLAWTLPPFLYLVLLSVKPERLIMERGRLLFWPTLERYRELLGSDLGASIWTSLVTSTTGALGWEGYLLGPFGGKTGPIGSSSIGIVVSLVLGGLLYSTLFVVPNRTGRHLGPVPVDAGSRL